MVISFRWLETTGIDLLEIVAVMWPAPVVPNPYGGYPGNEWTEDSIRLAFLGTSCCAPCLRPAAHTHSACAAGFTGPYVGGMPSNDYYSFPNSAPDAQKIVADNATVQVHMKNPLPFPLQV